MELFSLIITRLAVFDEVMLTIKSHRNYTKQISFLILRF